MTRRSVILGLSVLPVAGCNRRTVARSLVELHIASDGDNLAFKPDHLSCAAGVDVRLFFHHDGKILDDPHDWVLLKPGYVDRFLADADKSPGNSAVIPANDQGIVLAATPLCGKQQASAAGFKAKVEPLLKEVEVDSQSVAAAADARDDAKLGQDHAAFASSVKLLLAAFPASVQPPPPKPPKD